MSADLAIKEPCRAATLSNITLSGLQTIDGVALGAGDRVLVRQQTSSLANGVYVAASGSWARASDFDGAGDVINGTLVLVIAGAKFAASAWRTAGTSAIVPGTDDIDFESAFASGSIPFAQSGSGAIDRTVEQKLRESVSVLDFGADPSGLTDSSPAIQAAIDTGRDVHFPDGVYRCQGLLVETDYQSLIGVGNAQIVKNDDGTLVEFSGRGCGAFKLLFEGAGAEYDGDIVVVSGPDCQFHACSSLHAESRALIGTSGTTQIVGGIWNSLDTAGYEFEFSGAENQYNVIYGISTSNAGGGILLSGGASLAISDSQFGKLMTADDGGGVRATGNRINGSITIYGSFSSFDNNNVSGASVTIGNGTDFISGIRWGATNVLQAGSTFAIAANVVESSFHLLLLASVSIVPSIASPNNDIWHARVPFTPTIAASSGGWSLGNGVLEAGYSRAGKQLFYDFSLTWGSTGNPGTGYWTITVPFKASRDVFGGGRAIDQDGSAHAVIAQQVGGTTSVYPNAPANTVTGSTPFAWATNDTLKFSLETTYAP